MAEQAGTETGTGAFTGSTIRGDPELEHRIATEILRLAREDLRLGEPPVDGVPLAGQLDSLALLSLVVAVEDRFQVILQDDEAAGARTLADLARLIAARAAPAVLP
jgi:acyl carrier protein